MEDCPMYKLEVQEVSIWGLLDSGADHSIRKEADWPKRWPLQTSAQTLRGLGFAQDPRCSASVLRWKDEKGHRGSFQPFVLQIPVSFWRRDVMTKMGVKMVSEKTYSLQVKLSWTG
ncbi:endogenous retrovirus group K member 19 Pro protein-like [Mus caroli]|uniref:Endogenous retrovirus group K member 19 Pro protein-like n=1 Tax=Mus caroli TaxID=10089 RepID=A0A6P5RAA2_MUSCR|nr:endogenous retrovirus group K member 19 Pro protein-like [Mus caroli]